MIVVVTGSPLIAARAGNRQYAPAIGATLTDTPLGETGPSDGISRLELTVVPGRRQTAAAKRSCGTMVYGTFGLYG